MAEDPYFSLRGASIGYDRPLLSDITLSVSRGEYWGVFGPNGGGKTTLVKTLLGAIPPLSGEVHRRAGVRVGYVPQLTALRDGFPLSVLQVLELGALDLEGLPPAAEALDRLGIGPLASLPFGALSGGQRQRVLVARALHRGPDVLVLDEPTNGIDLVTRHGLMHLFAELNRDGIALLLITHHLAEVGPEVDRFLWLDAGEGLCIAGGREEVLGHPAMRRAYGGVFRVAEGSPGAVSWTCPRGEDHSV